MTAHTPTIGFVSLGCPKATVDSERILTQLRAEGYGLAPSYNGADLVVRAFFKPISTLRRGLASVDLATGESRTTTWERSDVTAIAATPVILESVVALVLADALLEKLGGDAMSDLDRSWGTYLERLRPWWTPPGA